MEANKRPDNVRLTRVITASIVAATLLVPVLTSVGQANAALTFPDPEMQAVWNRTDKPVQEGKVSRSWMWGPDIFYTAYEPYLEGPAGQHLVAYSDKSRMEINNPNGDRNNAFFVTNGLLVVDMMAGRIQIGNNSFTSAIPANIPVAGDTSSSVNAPTYASLAPYASLNGDHRAPDRTGQQVSEGLQRTGGVGIVSNLAGYTKYSVYEPTLGHNIPDVFWKFMNQRGPVWVNNRYGEDTVINWVFAMGYPLTEAYWIPIQVGSEQKWVLMQAFQRRILTYTPGNPKGFEVEMANVGRTYFDWRYSQGNPPAGQPLITVSPSQGDASTGITVNGTNFPRNAQVTINVASPDGSYSAGVGTVSTNGNGAFSAGFKLPAQATKYNSVAITATSGQVTATASFKLSFSPRLVISPTGAIIKGGTMTVSGSGFPANVNVQIGLLFDGSNDVLYPASAGTDGNGAFSTGFNIGSSHAAGTKFLVFATAPGGVKATYPDRVTIYNRPNLQVVPGSGPVGVNVTVQGSGWPAGQQVTIGFKGAGSSSEALWPVLAKVNNQGIFAATILLDKSLSGKGQVIISATVADSGLRVETTYTITGGQPTPVPGRSVTVSPSALQVGQSGTVSGSGWTPGSIVLVSLRSNAGQENIVSITAGQNGKFSAGFVLGARWANAGVLQVVATTADGVSASTTLNVIGSGGNNLEYGLAMTVQTYAGAGGPYVKLAGQGWQPGLNLTISVVSPSGDVNYGVANAPVKDDGTWQASFNNTGPWVGRSDLGVRAAETTGQFRSGRRLPVTNLTKVTGGTYTLSGSNWVPGSRVSSTLLVDGNEQDGLGSATVDGNGNFAFNIVVPRANGEKRVRITSSGDNGIQYQAVFGFDASGGFGDTEAGSAPTTGEISLTGAAKAAPKAAPLVGMPATGDSSNAVALWAIAPASVLLVVAGVLIVRHSRSLSS